MIPPADLIAQLEAGNPDSKYTGKFSGAVTLGAGSCDRRRDRQLLGTVVAPFVGEEFTMSFLAKELECPRIFRGGVMCRIWKLLRRLRGSS